VLIISWEVFHEDELAHIEYQVVLLRNYFGRVGCRLYLSETDVDRRGEVTLSVRNGNLVLLGIDTFPIHGMDSISSPASVKDRSLAGEGNRERLDNV